MKAVVFHHAGDIRLEEVEEPLIEKPTDAIIKITTSAICGTDLHFVRGTVPAGRIFPIGHRPDRLEVVRRQGAEIINFDEEDPVQTIKKLTGGIGVDCAIDAVGVDAECSHHGPASAKARHHSNRMCRDLKSTSYACCIIIAAFASGSSK